MVGDGTGVVSNGLHRSRDDGCATPALGRGNGFQFVSYHRRGLPACRVARQKSIVKHEWIMPRSEPGYRAVSAIHAFSVPPAFFSLYPKSGRREWRGTP